MKNIILLLALLFMYQISLASSPKSDPSLMTITRTELRSLANGDQELTYKVGTEAQNRLTKKVADLCNLENIKYEITQISASDEAVILKITLKNGLLVQDGIKSVISELP